MSFLNKTNIITKFAAYMALIIYCKTVNLVTKVITVTEIMNFAKRSFFYWCTMYMLWRTAH